MKITVNSDKLHRSLKALIPFICRDETRFHLNGVLLQAREGKLTLVATDGHKLAKAEILADVEIDSGDRECIVPLDLVKSVIRNTKPSKRDPDRCLGIDFNETEYTIAFNMQTNSSTGKTIESNFPHYEAVIPARRERQPAYSSEDENHVCYSEGIVGCNPKYLADTGKSCAIFGGTSGVVMQCGGELDPIRFDVECTNTGKLTCVIMPMTVSFALARVNCT